MLETYNGLRKLAIGNKELYQLTDEDIAGLQKILLGAMKDIDHVCEKYHLTYALAGGAMLGMVRHKGFIPWDDDIDICMPRMDFDKFPEFFKREFGDKYWLQDVRTDAKYDLHFMKVRVKNTEFMEVFDTDEEKAGIFIDIYPVENTFSNPVLKFFHGIISDGLLLICSCVRMYTKKDRLLKYTKDSEINTSIRLKVFIGRIFSIISFRRWLLFTEKWLSIYKNHASKWVSIPSGRKHFFGELYERDVFFPGKRRPFETENFVGMNEAEPYLKRMYGSYLTVPDEEERERHSVLRFALKKTPENLL